MIFKDYYKILGLDTNRVSLTEIKNAYREQAKKYHPDVNVGSKNSEERFKDINEAYRILSDPLTKRKYDRMWNRNVITKRTSYSYNSKNDLFTMFFGDISSNSNVIKKKNEQIKGEDLKIEISLKIEEAYFGVKKTISYRTIDGNQKRIDIKIQAGVKNNQIIRVASQGNLGKNGGSNGDLLVKIKIINEEDFKLEGNNIRKILNLSPWEAVLGTKVKLKILNEELSVYIPSGTSTGDIIEIEEKGYVGENGKRGKLLLETKIVISKNITDNEKKLYGDLKKISKYEPIKS